MLNKNVFCLSERKIIIEEHERIFKSYLRAQMRHLKAIKMALENKDFETAERLTDELVKDTQSGIED